MNTMYQEVVNLLVHISTHTSDFHIRGLPFYTHQNESEFDWKFRKETEV